ncbi:peptidoglycan DD-metalloendopeptidase family protein [Rubrobacter marinus]|uniref:Peptidoglycan DD-metalloendopeptidase family protein n=1 Tax=Rubrobacter marinus TaxID=2653852 RepID=A0A6G8PZ80_9ACTN|nr:M23 family metallopeptidase [Rubrobacter marinus]QIN79480.1 peptidoglycan DD-metalloendopeptidase family protein [Rubrobacter marinus]
MLTYPRFAKACYVFFAVAVLAAVLKLSISGAETGLLRMLPAVPTASAVEPAATSAIGPEDPRLGGFMQAGEAESFEAALTRPAPREDEPEGAAGDPAAPSGDGPSDDASAVFRRPSLERDPASEPVCGDLGDVPRSSRVVFPLPEEYFDSYDDTWGAARPQGGHEGSDLMSPAGTPEFAVTDGRLVAVAGSNENGWNRLGGYAVMLEAAYDVGPIKKGDLFYYAHLDRESSLPVGTEVRAGQKIGTVGDTGEGPEVTRGKFPPHLHLGWYDAELSEDRSEAESGAMNPYPMLLWLERNGGAVSGGTDAAYCQAPRARTPPPRPASPTGPPRPPPARGQTSTPAATPPAPPLGVAATGMNARGTAAETGTRARTAAKARARAARPRRRNRPRRRRRSSR